MPRRLYPAIVHTDDGETFGVSFVDFPVHAGGDSVEAAVADAEIVIAEVVEDLLRSREPIPPATAVTDIPVEDRDGAELVTLVPAHLPGKSRVISITLDEELIARDRRGCVEPFGVPGGSGTGTPGRLISSSPARILPAAAKRVLSALGISSASAMALRGSIC